MRIIIHSIFFPSQDLGSRDLDEDWLDCGLTETDSSGYLHLPHITQVFRKKTHCLQRIHNTYEHVYTLINGYDCDSPLENKCCRTQVHTLCIEPH